MAKLIIPENYKPRLYVFDTQKAISLIKRIFADNLCGNLNLRRVSAPLFVDASLGMNDDLNGVERPVRFDVPEIPECDAAVVQSLAKWKRMALKKYEFSTGMGLYTDMNAIRRDEELDNLHSIYVDQWDWEKVINRSQRTMQYLEKTVDSIVAAICTTQFTLDAVFPQLAGRELKRDVFYISTAELETMYPDLTPKEREYEITKEHKTVCLTGIGDNLSCGEPHDGRAPDYDDWRLNCDILFWHDVLGCPIEISSMGIRVDDRSLDHQLHVSGCDDRRELAYHKALLNGELPLTIGGGIGQSRLCMLLLGCAHIGEVQVSLWDKNTVEKCHQAGINIL